AVRGGEGYVYTVRDGGGRVDVRLEKTPPKAVLLAPPLPPWPPLPPLPLRARLPVKLLWLTAMMAPSLSFVKAPPSPWPPLPPFWPAAPSPPLPPRARFSVNVVCATVTTPKLFSMPPPRPLAPLPPAPPLPPPASL